MISDDKMKRGKSPQWLYSGAKKALDMFTLYSNARKSPLLSHSLKQRFLAIKKLAFCRLAQPYSATGTGNHCES